MTSSIPQALSLPPKPPSVCETCWKGPLAAQLGLLATPVMLDEERIIGGYSYSISGLELEHGSASGCALCTFLLGHGVPSRDARQQAVDQVKITLGSKGVPFCIPAKAQELNVVVNDEISVFEGLVHTSSGIVICYKRLDLLLTLRIRQSCNSVYCRSGSCLGRWLPTRALSREGTH